MHSALTSFIRQFVVLASALGAAVLFVTVAAAWTGPSGAPPNYNVPAPVNVGTAPQVKNGGLGVTTLVADQLCLGEDCITMWPGGEGSGGDGSGGTGGSSLENAQQIWGGWQQSGSRSTQSYTLSGGARFSEFKAIAWVGSGEQGAYGFVPTSLCLTGTGPFFAATFSGDDSGYGGFKCTSDTTFELTTYRNGNIGSVYGFR